MKLAMVGLGRMGGNMAQRLLEKGHEVVVYDISEDARRSLASKGAVAVDTLAGVVGALSAPRVVWLMLPAGKITADALATLEGSLSKGDVIVDGGNSNYKEVMATPPRWPARVVLRRRRHVGRDLGPHRRLLPHGRRATPSRKWRPVFLALAPEGGYAHVGPPGAGHFVKMVHNGIEYGLMQAYAEGFELMRAARSSASTSTRSPRSGDTGRWCAPGCST